MRTRILNCGLMRPRGARQFIPKLAEVPCLCLLVEGAGRLVLVDAGLGTRDALEPGRLGHANLILNAARRPDVTALRQLERLGHAPGEVTDIICTHLDRDHAGGLSDFPAARVHVHRAELEAARRPSSRSERERYRPRHFEHGPLWVEHVEASSEPWFGMECIRPQRDLPEGIVLVPLPGHTRGHCGVAVESEGRWILHCGDAFYVREELEDKPVPAGVRHFRRVAHNDYRMAMLQLARLSSVVADNPGRITAIASHDFAEYMALQTAPAYREGA